MMRTVAIFAINENSYSETFIQAHKDLPFNIKYYYDVIFAPKLEGAPPLNDFKIMERIKKRLNRKFNLKEHALINSLKREKVDCVLVEYGPTACETLRVVDFLKLPIVVHFHGYDASERSVIEKFSGSYRKVFAYANAIVVVSVKMKQTLIELGCPSDKITISHYGPNSDFLNNKPLYSEPQFVSVGRFVDKKAPYLTIAAFRKVVDAFPKAKLIMGGDGELLGICKSLVKALDLSDNIEFKGALKKIEILALFKESLAFVQHSIVAASGDSEGTPVAILEAQAASLPVISTYHAGIPDVVINDETGLLVPEHDVAGMAKNMIRLLNEHELAHKLGTAARKRIVECFTMERHLKTLQDLIDKACEKKVNK